MLFLITIVFMGIFGYVYWKAALYTAPFFMAFVFGKTHPIAMWAERLFVFGPSFYFTFSVVNYFMRNEWERGAIESTFVSIIAGLGLGFLAYNKYVQQSTAWGGQS